MGPWLLQKWVVHPDTAAKFWLWCLHHTQMTATLRSYFMKERNITNSGRHFLVPQAVSQGKQERGVHNGMQRRRRGSGQKAECSYRKGQREQSAMLLISVKTKSQATSANKISKQCLENTIMAATEGSPQCKLLEDKVFFIECVCVSTHVCVLKFNICDSQQHKTGLTISPGNFSAPTMCQVLGSKDELTFMWVTRFAYGRYPKRTSFFMITVDRGCSVLCLATPLCPTLCPPFLCPWGEPKWCPIGSNLKARTSLMTQ